jgi:ligand-binding sensor domain-containing protein
MPWPSFRIALFALPLFAGAVDPFPHAVPGFQVHTSREGLPQNTISALAHDREGRLWAATQDGLASWNGRTWRVHNLPDRQVSNFLRCLAVSSDGALWVGRQDGGLARFAHGQWELVSPGKLGARRVDALLEVRGRMWAATPSGLFRQEGQGWVSVFSGPCRSLDWSPEDGRVWLGMERGLARVDDDGSLDFLPGRGLEGIPVNRVLRRKDGSLLAATESGLYQWGATRWIPKSLPIQMKGQGVSSLAETEGHAGPILWVGTRDGLAVQEAGTWRVLGSREGLPGRYITALLPEGNGIWIGINEGLAFHKPGLWRAFTAASGLPSPSVFCIAEAQGTLWLGCREGGLTRLEPDGRWRVFTRRDGLPVDGVFSMAEHLGQLWAGTAGGGVARWAQGRWTQDGVPPAFRKGSVRRLEADRWGFLWAVTGNRGLWRLTPRGWQVWSPADGPLPTQAWHSLVDAGENGLWLGSEGAGLVRIQKGRTTVFDRDHGFPNNTILSLRLLRRADGRPVLLAGSEGSGLLWTLLDEEPHWQTFSDSTEPALPNNTVYQIQVDDSGRIYLFTNRGVARLTHGFGLGPQATVETFTTESGLPSNEFNGGASLRDSRGRIWGGSVAGAAGLDPGMELPPDQLPALVLESALAGDKELHPGLALSHRDRPFRIEAALLAFHRPGEIRYRTQITGLDERPGEWTPDGHRDFPSLPSGEYVLNLWAREAQGRIVGPLQLPFKVKPAPWATGWAFAGYALAATGLAVLWMRWRLGAVTRRNAELERRIQERTRTIEEQRNRIAQLMASSAEARVDLGAWVQSAVEELAANLGMGPIGVFVLEEREWSPLTAAHSLPAPKALEDREQGGADPEPSGPQPLLAVRGPSGELQGALVLAEAEPQAQDLGILRGFAAQLGAMLELQRTQEALRQSRIQRAQAQAISGQGAAFVQICPRCCRCFGPGETACPEDGSALESPQLLPFCLQDRYELQRLLGEGGMGLVFRARDLRLGRDVAVKVLKSDITGSDGLARFRQEAHALAAIHHPGVVAIFDSGELEQGAAYLVTELLEGHPLNDLLKTHGRGSFQQVARLLRQASAALGAAHRAGLLHRDLKPANLYLVPEPGGFQAKLLDFGLVKSLRAASGMTQAGKVIGTPNYMSPEQVRGQVLDARSDVWSFAALAFEAITGHRLVAATGVGEAFLAISKGRFTPPSDWVPALPHAVDLAFQAGLHLDFAARPADVEAWVASFVAHLESTPDAIPGWPLATTEPVIPNPQDDSPTLAIPEDDAEA